MNNENIKMTDVELNEVKILQEKFQQKVFQLGQSVLRKKQVELELKNANELEAKLLEDWNGLQKMETELIDKLLKKYGEGTLDLSQVTFTPDVKPPVSS